MRSPSIGTEWTTPTIRSGAANQLLNRVDSYHSTYGRPIWLTEFAIHDWGDNYTDEEIRAANKIFLEHVIPGLESRSYVEKFAFYNWFSDSDVDRRQSLGTDHCWRSVRGDDR